MAATETSSASLVAGRYRLGEDMSGGMAGVYRATDTQTGREVVLKMAPTADFERASALTRERETLVRLEAPGIVRCLDLLAEGDQTVLVLEHVPGQDLAQVLQHRDLQMDEARLLDWGIQLARILCHLHEQPLPVIYRDLKPGNIILGPNGQLTLVDFGTSRVRRDQGKDTIALGTPGYAPPEQYQHTPGSSDERSDVYSLGVTLFELATRRDPEGFHFDFPPLSKVVQGYSQGFERLLAQATHPNPAQRPPGVRAMLAELETLAGTRKAPNALLDAVPYAAAVAGVALAGRLAYHPELAYYNTIATGLWGIGAALGLGLTRQARGSAGLGSAERAALATSALACLLPVDLGYSWLTRLALEWGAPGVPLQPTLALLPLFALVLGGVGFLAGSVRQRTIGWRVLAVASMVLVGYASWGLTRANARDLGVSPNQDALPPLWVYPLAHQAGNRLELSPMFDAGANERYLGVQSEDKVYRVLRVRDGREAWSLRSTGAHQHTEHLTSLLDYEGKVLTCRALGDGHTVWQQTLPAGVVSTFSEASCDFVGLENGTLVALDPKQGGRILWSVALPGGAQVADFRSTDQGVLYVIAERPSRIVAINTSNGHLLWDIPRTTTNFFSLNTMGPLLLWASDNQAEILDATSGKTLSRFSLNGPTSVATGPRVMNLFRLDASKVLAALGNEVATYDLTTSKLDHRVTLWDRRASLRVGPQGSGALAFLSGSRMQGLDLRTQTVGWETWTGGLQAGLLQNDRPPQYVEVLHGMVFCQQDVGQSLRAYDETNGTLVWEHVCKPGEAVESLRADEACLYIISSVSGKGSQLSAYTYPSALYKDHHQEIPSSLH